MRTLVPSALLVLFGGAFAHGTDTDEDGWIDEVDCAVDDPESYPGAEEICDDADNDCDEFIDEEPCNEGCLGLRSVVVFWMPVVIWGAWTRRRLD